MKKSGNKTVLFLGLLFIIVAFVCVIIVVYHMIDQNQRKEAEIKSIQEKIAVVTEQNASAQKTAQDLTMRVGHGIEVDALLSAAQQRYGDAESSRTRGDLWIDRDGGVWMITLGALNGVKKGSYLRVVQDDKKVGTVVVRMALDVVAYVDPVEDVGQFTENIYQVVLE